MIEQNSLTRRQVRDLISAAETTAAAATEDAAQERAFVAELNDRLSEWWPVVVHFGKLVATYGLDGDQAYEVYGVLGAGTEEQIARIPKVGVIEEASDTPRGQVFRAAHTEAQGYNRVRQRRIAANQEANKAEARATAATERAALLRQLLPDEEATP